MPNRNVPLPQVLTGGQPRVDHFSELAEAGYRTVVDLRAPEEPRGFEEADVVARSGMEYVNLPVRAWELGDTVFAGFRELLRDTERPLVVHCGSGNRVGALLIPYLMLEEQRSAEDALAIAREVGLRSPELAQRAFAYVERERADGSSH